MKVSVIINPAQLRADGWRTLRLGSVVTLPTMLYGTPRRMRIVEVKEDQGYYSGFSVTGIASSKSRGNGQVLTVDSGWIPIDAETWDA